MPAPGAIKLPDVNVWLALSFGDHAHHNKASAWFDQQPEGSCAFCRITQMGLLRLLTNSKVMGPFVQSQQGAWMKFDAYLRDPRVTVCAEPSSLETEFRKLTSGDLPAHALWTDSYLAAFAITSGLTLVSFDQGVRRFSAASLEILS